MLKTCAICGKHLMMGRAVTRKGSPKKKGGTGRKTARTSRREFFANLQKIRILVNNLPNASMSAQNVLKKAISEKPKFILPKYP